MPVPFILAGLGVAAGVLGAGGHLTAKDTNEKAEKVSEEAKEIYMSAKASLAKKKQLTEVAITKLGESKIQILGSSIQQFLRACETIKHMNVTQSVGLNELSKLVRQEEDVLQLREMSDIYKSQLASGVAGATAGVVASLAVSGSLATVTSVLGFAGSTLAFGGASAVGAATGIAGSALSIGAAATPLAAIAAPALFFTGISASMKADENLEKANTMYAEAEMACEKMKTSEVQCEAIARRADMFNNVLLELNDVFAECARLMDGIVGKKKKRLNNKLIPSQDFTEDEKKVIKVTISLAKAVKTIIDTPILGSDGILLDDAETVYEAATNDVVNAQKQLQEIRTYNIKVNTKATKVANDQNSKNVVMSILVKIFGIGIALGILAIVVLVFSFGKTIIDEINSNFINKASDAIVSNMIPSYSSSAEELSTEIMQTESAVVETMPYIIPDSSTRYLSTEEIMMLTEDERIEAYYEIGAKKGIIYNDERIQSFFENKSWYKGTVSENDFGNITLNQYEQSNLELLYKIMVGDDAGGETYNHTDYESAESVEQDAITMKVNYDSYILPEADTVYYTIEDLQKLSKKELRLGRNEIYARHGRKFQTADLDEYFSSQSWYDGHITSDEFDEGVLNKFEKYNLDLIKSLENMDIENGDQVPSFNNVDWRNQYNSTRSQEERIRESQRMDTKQPYLEIYSLWDGFLNDLYQHIKSIYSDEEFEKIRVTQREWINNRDSYAERAASGYEGVEYDIEYYNAMTEMTKARISNLMDNYLSQ